MNKNLINNPHCFKFNLPLDKKTGIFLFAKKHQEYFEIIEDVWNNDNWNFKFGNSSIGLKIKQDIDKCKELVSMLKENAGQVYFN